MRLLILPVIIGAALAAGGPAVDLAAAPAKNPVLKFWLADNPGEKILSDGEGVYQHGIGGVTAYIDKADGNRLVIYTGPKSTRKFWIWLDSCLPDSTCDDYPFIDRLGQGQFLTNAKNVDGTPVPNGLLGMSVGSTGERLAPMFTYLGEYGSSVYWTLCKSRPDPDTFCGVSDNSTPARVVRTAADTWTFTASAATGSDVSQLIRKTGNRNADIDALGSYNVPFTLTVQCVKPSDCPTPAP